MWDGIKSYKVAFTLTNWKLLLQVTYYTLFMQKIPVCFLEN